MNWWNKVKKYNSDANYENSYIVYSTYCFICTSWGFVLTDDIYSCVGMNIITYIYTYRQIQVFVKLRGRILIFFFSSIEPLQWNFIWKIKQYFGCHSPKVSIEQINNTFLDKNMNAEYPYYISLIESDKFHKIFIY